MSEWRRVQKNAIQWNIQWIPKKIPKRFRCRFPADHKKYTLNQVNE